MNKSSMNFHFCRLFIGDTLALSLARHEHYLFSHLDLKPKMQILEIGCGLGTAALELAELLDVFVIGVDSDVQKIDTATNIAKQRNLSDRVTFLKSDYSDLRSLFRDDSFDAIYCIESLKSFSSFKSIYQGLWPLLRPGRKLAVYEWCWTQGMNPDDATHRLLAECLESSTGIGSRPISERSYMTALEALKASEFQVTHQEDLTNSSGCAMIPWYAMLDSAFLDAGTRWSRMIGDQGDFGGLTKNAAMILSQAGHHRLFTPMALFVAKRKCKPEY